MKGFKQLPDLGKVLNRGYSQADSFESRGYHWYALGIGALLLLFAFWLIIKRIF